MTTRKTDTETNSVNQNKKVLDTIIIGTGFSGICMAIKLKQAGIGSIKILEQRDTIGGTWRDNTYPGAECDVQSHLYSFSFEPNPNWKKMFGEQSEILAYMNFCVDKYDLRHLIEFNTSVKGIYFQEESGIWEVHTESGQIFLAHTVVSGNGGLSRPSLPDIKGLDSFKGKIFHSAKWDHSYDLNGKEVAVIGTGASAIQIVPAIAPIVKKLNLFQRTPPWIISKSDREISDQERLLYSILPITQQLYREYIYWILEIRILGLVLNPDLMKAFEQAAREYLKKSIKNPILQEKLTPNYLFGCKRILLSNNYYPALERKNVELITSGIEEVREKSILTKEGKEIFVDTIIAATGFHGAKTGAPFEIIGIKNQSLNETWKLNGAKAYLGITVSGFPNLFLMTGPNSGLAHSSMIYIIESQAQYITQCIKSIKSNNLKYIEVKQEVQDTYNSELQMRLQKSVWADSCNSWYVDKSGRNTSLWPGFTLEFKTRTFAFNPTEYNLVSQNNTKLEANVFDIIKNLATALV
jgi:cation diffusion facilitator CzcD-associated flavoprotein CzcO